MTISASSAQGGEREEGPLTALTVAKAAPVACPLSAPSDVGSRMHGCVGACRDASTYRSSEMRYAIVQSYNAALGSRTWGAAQADAFLVTAVGFEAPHNPSAAPDSDCLCPASCQHSPDPIRATASFRSSVIVHVDTHRTLGFHHAVSTTAEVNTDDPLVLGMQRKDRCNRRRTMTKSSRSPSG